jgi:hypothetical protein
MKLQAPNSSIGFPGLTRHPPAANTAACKGVAGWRAHLGRHGSVAQAEYVPTSVTTGGQWTMQQMEVGLAFCKRWSSQQK